MSNYIPSYYRYVSKITILDGGNNYTSIPTLTISGGGGSGATATCTIYNGSIQTVTITNIGTGYFTAPTITVLGGGGFGADLAASLSFAAGTGSEYESKPSLLVTRQLPEFIQTDYPKFLAFINKYFEWMELNLKPNSALYQPKFLDIDSAPDVPEGEHEDQILKLWGRQLAIDVPESLAVDRKKIYKRIKDLYETKGSRRSIEMFFRLLYNEEVEVYYPQKFILVPSDGRWVEEQAVVARAAEGKDLLDVQGKLIDITYGRTIGSITTLETIPATVKNVSKIAYTFPPIYELNVEFDTKITSIPGPGSGGSFTLSTNNGVIDSVTVLGGGEEYIQAPTLRVFDTGVGEGAVLRANVTDGVITSVTILEGGENYTNPFIDIVTEGTETQILLRGAHYTDVEGYLDRTLVSVETTGTYSSNMGFSVGDIFVVNETGDDGRGYALDYFQDNYVIIGGNNKSYIKVEEVDSNNVPTRWSIVNSGGGFFSTSTIIPIISKAGQQIDITIRTGHLFSYPGKYLDDRGKLSDANKLQDNYRYQKYSYVVKSGIPQSKWNNDIRKLVHPAGMEVFGDLLLKHEIDFSTNLSVVTDGYNLSKYITVDVIDAATALVELDFTKNIPIDVVNTSEFFRFNAQLAKEDSVTLTDNDRIFDLILRKTDSTNIADVTELVVTYNRERSESLNAIDSYSDVITYIRSFTENNLATENLDSLSVGKFITTSANMSEDSSFDLSLNKSELISTSEIPSISFTQGAHSESITVLDSIGLHNNINPYDEEVLTFEGVELNIQGYVSEDYFLEDYVGTVISFINRYKQLADSLQPTEVVSKGTQTTKTDEATTAESGSYVLETYSQGFFKEDYVGTSSTIT